MPPIKVIVTGATGMVGEGVLHTCLRSAEVSEVLSISRRSCGVQHPKLKEILHADFLDLSSIAGQLIGYQACFFCLGVSSVGMQEADYFKRTHTLTLHMAETLVSRNPGMTFCYVSGAGTDSSEKGRLMWARVKGKTENDLMQLPFKAAYAFRPGFIKPMKGMHFTNPAYKYVNWMFPIGRALAKGAFCTLDELSRAMLNAALSGYEKKVLEGKDIIALGNRI